MHGVGSSCLVVVVMLGVCLLSTKVGEEESLLFNVSFCSCFVIRYLRVISLCIQRHTWFIQGCVAVGGSEAIGLAALLAATSTGSWYRLVISLQGVPGI